MQMVTVSSGQADYFTIFRPILNFSITVLLKRQKFEVFRDIERKKYMIGVRCKDS